MTGHSLSEILTEIRRLAEQVATREGCYVYDLEMTGGGVGRVLRLTIEKDIEGGVSIEDCTNVSRGLNLILDVEDVVPGGNYNLEVSSPGLERVLKEPRHYGRAIGQKISVKTFAALLDFNPQFPQLGKAKQIQGTLLSYDDAGLKIRPEAMGGLKFSSGPAVDGVEPEAEVYIPFATITKAHVVFEFADPQAKKPGHGKGKSKK